MAGEERPPQNTGSEIVPFEDDMWQDFTTAETAIYNETFQSIREMLGSLAVRPDSPSYFSTPVDGEWVRMLAVSHGILIGGSGGVTVPGQRLIINHTQTNNLVGERSMNVGDYLLYSETGTMFGIHSEVFQEKESHTWNLDAGSAPFIELKSDSVNVHLGVRYREDNFEGRFLTQNDALLSNRLLRTLQVFSPASQEEIGDIRYQTYTNL